MIKVPNGEEIFVIDAHIALWDARKENRLNIHGEQFINCFYDYHKNLSPKEFLWPREEFDTYSPEKLVEDVFVRGYADMAIFQPVLLSEFYKNGFGDYDVNEELSRQFPGRFICNGGFDPRHGDRG